MVHDEGLTSTAPTSKTLPHSPLFKNNIPQSQQKSKSTSQNNLRQNTDAVENNTESTNEEQKAYSLTADSAGRELTEGQREYFKNSKVVVE